jgi:hypothetical protein
VTGKDRWIAAIWITTVVVPITQVSILLTGHTIGDAVTGSGAAALIATEVVVRLLGKGGQPPTSGFELAPA